MGRTLHKAKARRESGAFAPVPCRVLSSEEFAGLSTKAVKLLFDLVSQLRFGAGGTKNNGDLTATWSIMRHRGWRSRDTLYKALLELEATQFVVKTRQGGLNMCSLYGITWWAIDECGGKLDVAPSRVPSNAWAKPIHDR